MSALDRLLLRAIIVGSMWCALVPLLFLIPRACAGEVCGAV